MRTGTKFARLTRFRLIIGGLLLGLLAGCANQATLLISDPSERIETSRITAAAEPLQAIGVRVALIVDERGDAAAFAQELAALNLLRGEQIAADSVAIYVGFEPHYSALRVGSNWSGYLPDARLEQIRRDVLNPALRRGEYTPAISATLAALAEAITSGQAQTRRLGLLIAGALVSACAALLLAPTLSRALSRSSIGRAAGRLWEQTPPGRERVRRRNEERSLSARSSCQRTIETVRKAFQRLPQIPPDLRERLHDLDRQAETLEQQALADLDLPAAYRRLSEDYRSLERDRLQVAVVFGTQAGLGESMQMLEQARRSLQRTGRKQQAVEASIFEQLDGYAQRLMELEQQAAQILASDPPSELLRKELQAIDNECRQITAATMALWKRRRPKDAAQRPQRRPLDLPYLGASAIGTEPQRRNEQGSSSYDSYDPPTSSGGESSAGGDW